MRRQALNIAATVLTLAAVVAPAFAGTPQQARAAEQGQARVIAVQVWADSLDGRDRRLDRQRFGVAPNNEAVLVSPGERVRLELVGSALFSGAGVEVPLNARFDVAAGGRSGLRIVQTGPNWVVVDTGNGSGVLGQIGYHVNDSYDTKGGIGTGRITLETGSTGGAVGRDVYDRSGSRWRRAEELASLLYRGILNASFDPRRDEERQAIEEIYRDGSVGVQNLAVDLARIAERRRDWRGSEVQRVGDLYRTLLGRDSSDRQLLAEDSGFGGNVDRLRREGLEEVVQIIVGSEEFRRVHDLGGFDALRVSAYQRDFRRDRVRDRDRNPYRD